MFHPSKGRDADGSEAETNSRPFRNGGGFFIKLHPSFASSALVTRMRMHVMCGKTSINEEMILSPGPGHSSATTLVHVGNFFLPSKRVRRVAGLKHTVGASSRGSSPVSETSTNSVGLSLEEASWTRLMLTSLQQWRSVLRALFRGMEGRPHPVSHTRTR